MSDTQPTTPRGTMTIDAIVDEFSRARRVGRPLPLCDRARPQACAARRARPQRANKVQGCASQVWLATTVQPNGAGGPVLTFVGDSDAHIVKGLIAILLATYSGRHATRHSRHRRGRAVRPARPARASDAAALERLPLHGGAHPLRRAGRCWRRRPDAHFVPPRSRVRREPGAHMRRAARRALPRHSRSGAPAGRGRAAARLWPSARPAALALDIFEALKKTADIEQQPGEFRPDGVERTPYALARRNHRLGEGRHAAAAAILCDRAVQLAVTRGIIWARVKSARSRSPACSCTGSINARPSRALRRASQRMDFRRHRV